MFLLLLLDSFCLCCFFLMQFLLLFYDFFWVYSLNLFFFECRSKIFEIKGLFCFLDLGFHIFTESFGFFFEVLELLIFLLFFLDKIRRYLNFLERLEIFSLSDSLDEIHFLETFLFFQLNFLFELFHSM